jgi:hypothetical protein
MEALEKNHAKTMEWLGTLKGEDLEHGGVHAAWGEQTVRSMLKILMLHDKMHSMEIVRRKTAAAP